MMPRKISGEKKVRSLLCFFFQVCSILEFKGQVAPVCTCHEVIAESSSDGMKPHCLMTQHFNDSAECVNWLPLKASEMRALHGMGANVARAACVACRWYSARHLWCKGLKMAINAPFFPTSHPAPLVLPIASSKPCHVGKTPPTL